MRTFGFIAVAAALLRTAFAQGLPMINTPAAATQCQPVLLTFSGGQAPYYLSILPAGQTTANPIENLPTQAAAGSYTWKCNLPTGTSFTLRITDGAGAVNYAAIVTVQASSDTTCLAASGSSIAVPTSTSASSASVAVSSTLTVTAPSSTTTAAPGPVVANITLYNGTTTNGFNLTCTQGQLTYGITTAILPYTLRQVTSFFGMWVQAAPGRVTAFSGNGIGSTRTYTYGNVTFQESLRTNESNAFTGALHQQWNYTTSNAVTLTPSLTVYNSFDDLTIYTNGTTQRTAVQYFILGCFNNQTTGAAAIASFINTAIANWTTAIGSSSPMLPSRRAIEF